MSEVKQYTPSQATGMPQLTKKQLDKVERALVRHFGFTWKHWESEAQLIWNTLSAPEVK